MVKLKGLVIGQSYDLNVIHSFSSDRYLLFHYGERFCVGEQALMIKDTKKDICYWFIFDSFLTSSIYKYVYKR
jgi:hypothetical protein